MRSRTLLCWASKVPTKVSPTRPSSAHTTLYGALLLAALEHPDAVVAAPQLGWVRDPQPQPAAAGPIALRVQQPAEALLEACDLGGRCLRSRAVLGLHGHGSIDRAGALAGHAPGVAREEPSRPLRRSSRIIQDVYCSYRSYAAFDRSRVARADADRVTSAVTPRSWWCRRSATNRHAFRAPAGAEDPASEPPVPHLRGQRERLVLTRTIILLRTSSNGSSFSRKESR
jgi:hypothetical protein